MVMQHNEMWAELIDLFSKPFRTSLHIILFFNSNVCCSLYMSVHIHNHLLAGRTYSYRNLQQYVGHTFFIFKEFLLKYILYQLNKHYSHYYV
jgi:hypothetical protein